MEAREGMSAGVTVIGAEAPSNYHVAARSENPSQVAGAPAPVPAPQPSPGVGSAATLGKKKRGRPRKYGPDGTVNMALSPLPLSSSAPPGLNFPMPGKRGKARALGFESKQHKAMQSESLGDWVACPAGTNFTPHIVTVNADEDVTMKIISFAQQGPRATCILSANGVVKNVTLRQPDSSGGTLTYEGRFEILSLTGSFTPTESGGTRGRAGGLSVSLASPDGRVVGGGVAGLLVAASPVQVVVGSFLPSNQHEQKIKKVRNESVPASAIPAAATMGTAATAAAAPTSSAEGEDGIAGSGRNNFNTPKPNFASSSSFRRENWAPMHSVQDSRKSTTDINISLPVG
ncbi:AT-hook motif nuclear-localized protein 1-like [Malania oleifera]|uniref:AT-hook motif nuclear-localized protein 1-like n=1 Tax=Malania oleifera TaxID=397392 RepID=UPI0025ADDD1A|nr:AT-hook motif nuclear-localized protein 1-like [Malania oleifera]XP_057981595.1 AT-hook motif nuclear-localized protein 1-like [Malania oleifera]XP_057981596.1 AT-hook motif nuclear-localized protein 1-like [Malania oleifera]